MKMKWYQFSLLMGAIYLAPRVVDWFANLVAAGFTVMSIYCVFKDE